MKNILVINLKRFGDIFTSAHLINSIKAANPDSNICMLVYKEFEPACKILTNIQKTFTIDRTKILNIKKNQIFSDALAINKFTDDINDLVNIKWDNVINFSNDLVSSYLISYLNTTTYTGTKINNKMVTEKSNFWADVYNEVIAESKIKPINILDTFHHMLNIPFAESGVKVKSNKLNDEISSTHFQKIREKESGNTSNLKIVGIQLKSSIEKKDLPYNMLVELIDNVLDDPNLYPVLIVSPNESEKSLASSINQKFDNSLVIVEADFIALPSVLKHLNLLITPDTAIKHLADLNKTPTLEIAFGSADFKFQGATMENSLVLTSDVECRPCSHRTDCTNNELLKCQKLVSGHDIYQAVKFFNDPHVTSLVLSKDAVLYQVRRNSDGIFFSLVAGSPNVKNEMNHLIGRLTLERIGCGKYATEVFTEIMEKHNLADVTDWIENEKNSITEVIKSILNCLRVLKQVSTDQRNGKNFVLALDAIISHVDSPTVSSYLVHLFRGAVDNLGNISLSDNLKEVERQIYNLKNNLQNLSQTLFDLSTNIYKTKQDLVMKNIFESRV